MTTIRKALIAIAIILLGGGALSQQGGSPPQITFISFPSQIQADGSIVSGFIGFKDPDGDLAKAEFVAVQAKYFPSFTLNLTLKGVKEGSFEFEISTTTPQSVTLRVTLIDEANNRSQPKEFSFEAVGTGAILQVSPTSLNFSSEVGRTPPSQTIQITNAGSGTLSWSANADQPWIELSPSRGIAPSILTVSLKSSNLEVGNYTGNITITAPGAQGSPAVVRVTLTVRPPAPPAVLDISPRQLEFHGYEGRSNPAPQTLTLRNSGGQPLTWTAQAEARWLTLSSSHGTLQVGESAQVQVFVDLTGLSVGTLQSRITFTAPEAQNSPVIVPVILRIEAVPPAVLEVAPKQLEFRGQEGGSNPVAQILTVRNTGEQVLTWAAQVNKAWLRVNPASGNLQGRESVQVYVYVDLAGLSSGTYEAQITITAPGAQGSPAIVLVTLVIESQRLPDLVIALGRLPSQAQPGETLQIENTVKNQGTANSSRFRVGVYLSLDRNWDKTDLLLEARTVDNLAPGAISTDTTTVRIPNDLFNRPAFQPGTLFVIVVADDQDQVKESNEENNIATAALTIQRRAIAPRLVQTIFVGVKGPTGVSVAPDGKRVYVAAGEGSSLVVVDAEARRVSELIRLRGFPQDVAVTPDGRFAYVTSSGNANEVLVVSTSTNRLVASIGNTLLPVGLAVTPDGKFVYVATYRGVAVIDTNSQKLKELIEMGIDEIRAGVAVTPDGKQVLIAQRTSDSIAVIDTSTNRIVRTISVGDAPWGVTVAPDGRFAYVTNPGSNNVSVINLSSLRVEATIDVGIVPADIRVTPDGNYAFLANFHSHDVTVLDLVARKILTTLRDPLLGGQTWGVAISRDGRFVYVTNNGPNTLWVIETGY
jgi:YVTN family beta-propeller protein